MLLVSELDPMMLSDDLFGDETQTNSLSVMPWFTHKGEEKIELGNWSHSEG